jgi:hypothetical protein
MKTAAVVLFLLVTAGAAAAAAQTAVESSFAKNKASLTREHLVMGEDASSGYDYLFYKKGKDIVKIRSIWSASYTKELRIEDLYYADGLVLVRRYIGVKRNLASLIRFRDVPLTPKEELHFSNSKMTIWRLEGKTIAATDHRWKETEKATLEHGKGELESYVWMKEDK